MEVYFSAAEQVEYHTDIDCENGNQIECYNFRWIDIDLILEALDAYPFLKAMIRECEVCEHIESQPDRPYYDPL